MTWRPSDLDQALIRALSERHHSFPITQHVEALGYGRLQLGELIVLLGEYYSLHTIQRVAFTE